MNIKLYLNKIKKLLKFTLEFVKYYILYPYAKFKYRGHNIYLFAERGVDARDNGYHMYKYIRKYHPEIESYYVITKDSPDYYKIKSLGNEVELGSLKHYLLFIASNFKISTHIFGYTPYSEFYFRFANKIHITGKKVFLQHGVITNNHPQLYKETSLTNLFICGAQLEYNYILEKFHYSDKEVRYTGLARYDNLYNNEIKNQILIMPTWRNYLSNKSKDEIIKSDYFIYWNSLLNNNKLIECAEKQNIKILFYPHFEMQKYLNNFQLRNQVVQLASFNNYDVQQLLKESKLLITDYSSVFFDFAYMKKPLLYYQFDKKVFTSQHYQEGYFNYENMGFGEVATNEKELVDFIINYIEKDFILKYQYKERCTAFFPLHDNHNCERIFNEIQKLN